MELVLDWGTIANINSQALDSQGTPTPSISVKSFSDGSVLTIPLASPAWGQFQPIEGMKVLFVRFGSHQSRVICFWGNNDTFIRTGEFAMNPGEVQIQSPSGLGYLKLGQDGTVLLVGGNMADSFEVSADGITARASNLTWKTYKNSVFQLAEDGSITVTQYDNAGTVTANININKDTSISIYSAVSIALKSPNIYIDGKVYMGTGASDPTARLLFGDVVTAGIFGTHPVDYVSGTPIVGSQTIKAA